MSVPEDQKGATPAEKPTVSANGSASADSGADAAHVSHEQTTDHDYDSHYQHDDYYHSAEDPYTQQSYPAAPAVTAAVATLPLSGGGGHKLLSRRLTRKTKRTTGCCG